MHAHPKTLLLRTASLLAALLSPAACTEAGPAGQSGACKGGKCDSFGDGYVGFGLHYDIREVTDWSLGDAADTIRVVQSAELRPQFIPYVTIEAVRVPVPEDGMIEFALHKSLFDGREVTAFSGAVLVLFEDGEGGLESRRECFDVVNTWSYGSPDKPRFLVNGMTRELALARSLRGGLQDFDTSLFVRRSFEECGVEPGDVLHVSYMRDPSGYNRYGEHTIVDRYETSVTVSGVVSTDPSAVTTLAGSEGPRDHVLLLERAAPGPGDARLEVITDYHQLVTVAGPAFELPRSGQRFSAAGTTEPWRLVLMVETEAGGLVPLFCDSGPQLGLDPVFHHDVFAELVIDWDERLLSTSSDAVLDRGDPSALPAEYYYDLSNCGIHGGTGALRVVPIPDPMRAPAADEPNLVGSHEAPVIIE